MQKKEIKTVKQWTFLSNHSHVILCLYRNSKIRISDISKLVGITDRAVIKIIDDLEEFKILTTLKIGRRNEYKINEDFFLRHSLEKHKTLGQLLKFLK